MEKDSDELLATCLKDLIYSIDLGSQSWTSIPDMRCLPRSVMARPKWHKRREAKETRPVLRCTLLISACFDTVQRAAKRATGLTLVSHKVCDQLDSGLLRLCEIAEALSHYDEALTANEDSRAQEALILTTRLDRLVRLAEEQELLLRSIDEASLTESAAELARVNSSAKAMLSKNVLPRTS